MHKIELLKALDYVNATRVKRMEMANFVLQRPHIIPILLEIIKEEHPSISTRACWIIEALAKQDIQLIFAVIDDFVAVLPKLKLESSIRSAAKICELLVTFHDKEKSDIPDKKLSPKHMGIIIESAFDWLIGEHKVAPKAYSMTTLLLLGKHHAWVHPALKQVITQNYNSGSAAYKARGRMTLKAIEKMDSYTLR